MAAKPEDLNLPASVVTKLVKDSLPNHVNISKEARIAIGRAASIFVLYTTACANNVATAEKRKTITPEDILAAMKDMEMDQFVNPLRKCLEAYRKASSKNNSKARAQSTGPAGSATASTSVKNKKNPPKSASKSQPDKTSAKQAKSNIKEDAKVKNNASKVESAAQKIANELQAQEDSDLSSSDGSVSDNEQQQKLAENLKQLNPRPDEQPMEVEQNNVRTKTASGLSASTDSQDESSLD